MITKAIRKSAIAKKAVLFLIAAALLICNSTVNAQVVQTVEHPEIAKIDGLRLVATTDKSRFIAGESVEVRLRIENTSKVMCGFMETQPDMDFSVSAKDAQGREVPQTAFGKMRLTIPFFRRVFRRIDPGQSISYSLNVNRLVDMSGSGNYSVTIRKGITISSSNAQFIDSGNQTELATTIPIILEEPKYLPQGIPNASLDSSKVASSVSDGNPLLAWKEGDHWTLEIELFQNGSVSTNVPQTATSSENDLPNARLAARYSIEVKIAGTEKTDKGDYWQVDFIPGEEAPMSVREQSYRVLVSKKDGIVEAVIGLRGFGNPNLIKADGISFARETPFGYPLLLFPLMSNHDFTTKDGLRFSMTTQTSEQDRVLDFHSIPQGLKGSEVKQVWPKADKWWKEYTLQDNDRQFILRAKRLEEH
jgi:hypothetical protein